MSYDLRSELMEIRGIGDSKADAIMAVLEDYDTGEESRLLEKARDAAMRGDDRQAGVWLRRDE